MTTIKVSKVLRDRISTDAANRRQTVHAFLEALLTEHERQQRLAQVAAAYAEADAQVLDEWRAETHEWETVDSDTEATQ
jgi:antitoxin MazE7